MPHLRPAPRPPRASRSDSSVCPWGAWGLGELPLHEPDDAGPEAPARMRSATSSARLLSSPCGALPARINLGTRPSGTSGQTHRDTIPMRRCGGFGRGFWFAESRRAGSKWHSRVTSSTLVSSTSNPVGNHRWGFAFSGVRDHLGPVWDHLGPTYRPSSSRHSALARRARSYRARCRPDGSSRPTRAPKLRDRPAAAPA